MINQSKMMILNRKFKKMNYIFHQKISIIQYNMSCPNCLSYNEWCWYCHLATLISQIYNISLEKAYDHIFELRKNL